uniref:Uncharacterized protein n=1 Tax=Anguilla anguilla TaxID=7936 RepID=A0A0E9VW83_ANGAN
MPLCPVKQSFSDAHLCTGLVKKYRHTPQRQFI